MGKVIPIKSKEWRLVKVTKGKIISIQIEHYGVPEGVDPNLTPIWFTVAAYPIEQEKEALEQFEAIIAPTTREILREV